MKYKNLEKDSNQKWKALKETLVTSANKIIPRKATQEKIQWITWKSRSKKKRDNKQPKGMAQNMEY